MTELDTAGAKTANGLLNGLIGVAIFSGSLPATRLAVRRFDPIFLTVARAAIAGCWRCSCCGFCGGAVRQRLISSPLSSSL